MRRRELQEYVCITEDIKRKPNNITFQSGVTGHRYSNAIGSENNNATWRWPQKRALLDDDMVLHNQVGIPDQPYSPRGLTSIKTSESDVKKVTHACFLISSHTRLHQRQWSISRARQVHSRKIHLTTHMMSSHGLRALSAPFIEEIQ